jgi:hypothetical protein
MPEILDSKSRKIQQDLWNFLNMKLMVQALGFEFDIWLAELVLWWAFVVIERLINIIMNRDAL